MKWLRAVLPVTVLVASGVAAAPADAAPGWQKYVVAPASRDVRPVQVLSTTGDVTNPNGLLGRVHAAASDLSEPRSSRR